MQAKLNPTLGTDSNPYTKALMHFNGNNGETSFVEDTGKAVTVVGNAQTSTAQKIVGSSSLWVRNSLADSKLTLADSDDWNFGAGKFSIGFWVYVDSFGQWSSSDTVNLILGQLVRDTYNYPSTYHFWHIGVRGASGQFGAYCEFFDNGATVFSKTSTTVIDVDTWYHIALVRGWGGNANDYALCINGVAETTWTDSSTLPDYAAVLNVGGFGSVVNYANIDGFMAELEIRKGEPQWTANFPPPNRMRYLLGDKGRVQFPGFQEVMDWTVPTVDTYTKALLHFNGADAAVATTEETGKAVTFVGTAQLDTAQKVFGTSSLLLDGNSDYITLADSDDWTPGSGTFTFDMRVRFNAFSLPNSGDYYSLLTHYNAGGTLYRSWLWRIYNDSGTIKFMLITSTTGGDATVYTSSGLSFSTNTWYHLAIVRDGNTLRFFLDGVAKGTADMTGMTIYNNQGNLEIGGYQGTGLINGWIDEVRISKGIARWTTDFTPPTSEYVDTYAAYSLTVDGDTDKEYIISARNLSSSAAFLLTLNNDVTNYGRQYVMNSGGTISAARSTETSLVTFPALSQNTINLLTPVACTKTAQQIDVEYTSGTTVGVLFLASKVFSSTSNVTLMRFATASGAFAAGTRIIVYARRSN